MEPFLDPGLPLKLSRVDYRKPSGSHTKRELAVKFLFEVSEKCHIKPLTVAAAAQYFHKFFAAVDVDHSEYDEFLISASTIYLASKVKDEPVKIRDLVNVVQCTLNRSLETPMENDKEFWSIRDSIIQAELHITRILKFDLTITPPHKYLLHYMKILQEWFGPVWTSMPIAKTAAGFVQDFHHSPDILQFQPSHIAICCLSLAFQICGIQVPVRENMDPGQWYTPLVGDSLSNDVHCSICEKILTVYDARPADL